MKIHTLTNNLIAIEVEKGLVTDVLITLSSRETNATDILCSS